MSKIKAVVFDMDGTLVDSRAFISRAMEDGLGLHGRSVTKEEMAKVTGKPVRVMYELLAPDLDAVALERAHYRHHAQNLHLLQRYDSANELLQDLLAQGYKLGIFTGGGKEIYDRLQMFELGSYFDSVVDLTRYVEHKPNPEGLLLCMTELGVNPQETVYVGDGITDMLAGRAAGVAATVGITHGFTPRQELETAGADHIIDSLAELTELIMALG